MQNNNLEQRFIAAELRLDDEKKTIRGQIPFDSWSQNLGGFVERIRKGAFQRSLSSGKDIWALFNHDSTKPLGRTTRGSLQLTEGEEGLEISISPNNTSWAADVLETIRSGDLSGFSFGFVAIEDEWKREGNQTQRELIEVDLLEVSPVFQPAYQASQVSVRALEEAKKLEASEVIEKEVGTAIELFEKQQKLAELKLKLNI